MMVSTKMFMLKGLLGLAAIGGANPVPEPEQLDARAVNCGAVNVALVSSIPGTCRRQVLTSM